MKRWFIVFICLGITFFTNEKAVYAQRIIDLTLDSAIDIALDNSYQVRQLQLSIERTRKYLEAERAGLKSRVYMNLQSPDIQQISDYKWDSQLQEDILVRQNTRMWQANLAIQQPVILFGYPTNGYLSLNNKVYRYYQKNPKLGIQSVNYYNRYFVKFEQPLFQPNRLRNDLEDAELDLERRELDYLQDLVRIIDRIADDYYEMYDLAYKNIIYSRHIENLEHASEIANAISEQDTSRSIEAIQVQVELSNAREKLAQNQSDIRLESARMKQRLRLNQEDSLSITPDPSITEIGVDTDQAIEYGYTLRPRMRLQQIYRRMNEIDLENTRGWNSFRVNLEMTYGLEKQDEHYTNLWEEQDNSYSVSLNAYIPIWDWGQRNARIEAAKINIKKRDLYIEENKTEIQSEIQNAVTNLKEYQSRASNMRENMAMAREITSISINQYQEGEISLQDLLQQINRQRETDLNFLEAYLGYRQSLLTLMRNTYYDYENNTALINRFREQMQ